MPVRGADFLATPAEMYLSAFRLLKGLAAGKTVEDLHSGCLAAPGAAVSAIVHHFLTPLLWQTSTLALQPSDRMLIRVSFED